MIEVTQCNLDLGGEGQTPRLHNVFCGHFLQTFFAIFRRLADNPLNMALFFVRAIQFGQPVLVPNLQVLLAEIVSL